MSIACSMWVFWLEASTKHIDDYSDDDNKRIKISHGDSNNNLCSKDKRIKNSIMMMVIITCVAIIRGLRLVMVMVMILLCSNYKRITNSHDDSNILCSKNKKMRLVMVMVMITCVARIRGLRIAS
jgi:hypothetical protein